MNEILCTSDYDVLASGHVVLDLGQAGYGIWCTRAEVKVVLKTHKKRGEVKEVLCTSDYDVLAWPWHLYLRPNYMNINCCCNTKIHA